VSLLFSKEFYAAAKKNLKDGGVLQTWCLFANLTTIESVARALRESFAYVRVFRLVEHRGFHFVASDHPFTARDARALAGRLPPAAARDLMEWDDGGTPVTVFAKILASEGPIDRLTRPTSTVPPLSDDRPVNEYFLMRWLGDRWTGNGS